MNKATGKETQPPLSSCFQNIPQAFLCVAIHGAQRNAVTELETELRVHTISCQLSEEMNMNHAFTMALYLSVSWRDHVGIQKFLSCMYTNNFFVKTITDAQT